MAKAFLMPSVSGLEKCVAKGTTSKKRQLTGKTPERTWNYKQVEAALAEVFSVAPGRLRGAW